jgi:hypothetical protein
MMRSGTARVMMAIGLTTMAAVTIGNVRLGAARWTSEDLETLRSRSLRSLEPLGPDASTRYADDPRAAARALVRALSDGSEPAA